MKKEAKPPLSENKYNCPYCGTYCPQYHYDVNKRVIDLTPELDFKKYGRRWLTGGSKQVNATNLGYGETGVFSITTCAECRGLTFWNNDVIV